MLVSLIDALQALETVLPASSDSEGSPLFFLLLGPLAGFGFYSMIVLRYRNADKRHQFERETSSVVDDLKTYDQQVSSVKGVRNSQIMGANHRDALQRLGQGTAVTVVPAPEHPIEKMMREGSAAPDEGATTAAPPPPPSDGSVQGS